MKKHFLKVVSAALCCAMLITCTQTITPVHASSLDDLQSQYNALQQQSDAIQNQMESTQNQIDAEVQKQDQIAAQAELTQQQIDVLTQKIEAYNTEISAKESEISTLETQISEKEQEITEKRNALEKRTDELMEFLRVMYMHDDVSSLDLILGAESFGDALSTAENIEHMSEYNEQVMKELEQQAQELETAKQELETSKTQLVEARTLLENDRSALEADQTTLNTKQSELENQLEQSKNSQTQLENMLGTLGVSQQEYNNNMAAIEQVVSRGLGVSIVSESVVRCGNFGGKIRYFKIRGLKKERTFYLVFNKNVSLSPAAEAFLRLVRDRKRLHEPAEGEPAG